MENNINKNIKELINKFNEIKNQEQIYSLRNGTTGIGYTFETLIGKKEDQEYLPDYNGIEIKTKLGYSKNPITLFTLVPKLDNNSSINFLLENYGYYTKNNQEFKTLRTNVYYNTNYIAGNRFIFKTKVEKETIKLKLLIYNKNMNLLNSDIYWNIDELYDRLEKKLKYLAIIKGYPYKSNNKTTYKYTNINIYKLKNKKEFLELIKKDKIYITFNAEISNKNYNYGKTHDRGTAFKIDQNYIEDLFQKIY